MRADCERRKSANKLAKSPGSVHSLLYFQRSVRHTEARGARGFPLRVFPRSSSFIRYPAVRRAHTGQDFHNIPSPRTVTCWGGCHAQCHPYTSRLEHYSDAAVTDCLPGVTPLSVPLAFRPRRPPLTCSTTELLHFEATVCFFPF